MITFKIETVTPAKARKYLESNAGNQRNVSEGWVVALAEMMERGEFNGEDGQCVKFATVGGKETLIDGQHRLRAVELYDNPVKLGVMRGLSESAFRTQDAAKGRTVENFYQIANQENAKVAAQVAKWLFNVSHGGSILGAKQRAVPGLIADWALTVHPDIPSVIGGVSQCLSEFQKLGMGTKAHLGYCYYEWEKLDPVYAHEVARFYATGEGDVSKTIRNARNFLIKIGVEDKAKHLAGNERLLKVITTLNAAWNADREGRRNLTSTARLIAPFTADFEKSRKQRSDGDGLVTLLRAA